MKKSAGLFLVLALGVVTGCAAPLRAPTHGLIYNESRAGLTATGNQAGTRVGESCTTSILGLVSYGDASIEAARRNGGITLISTVDETFHSVFVFFAKHCTLVRGR